MPEHGRSVWQSGTVLPLAAASLAVLMAFPGTAAGVPRQSVVSTMTTQEPGAPTGSSMEMRFVNPADPQAKPYAADKAVIQMAEGVRMDDTAVPQCNVSDAELTARGEAACPPESKVQTGRVEFDTGSPFLFPPRAVFVRTVTFNKKGGLVTLGVGENFPVQAVGHTQVDGETVTVKYTDNPGGPPDNYTAMKIMTTGGPPVVGAGGRPFMRSPPVCPPSGRWVTRYTFIYHDGARETAAAETPCRRRAGCLNARERVRRRGIGPVRLGARRARLLNSAARLPRSSRRVLAFCVTSRGGRVRAAFDRSGRAVLVVTTAAGHSVRSVAPGTTARRFVRVYPRRRHVARGIYRTAPRSSLIVAVRNRRVHFVGVVRARILRDRGAFLRRVRGL